MKENLKRFFQFLKGNFPVERRTLGEFLVILLVLLLIMVFEFAVNYWSKNNLTFWNPLLQALPTYLVFAAPVLLLGGKGGKIYAAIMLTLLLLVNLTGALILIKFKVQFDADVFFVMMVSSTEEFREFLGSYFGWGKVAGAVLFFLLLTGCGIWGICKLKLKSTRWTRTIGALILLPFIICTVRYYYVDRGKIFTRTCATRVIAGLYMFRQQWHSMVAASRKPQIPEKLTAASTKKPLLGIFVIGESAMRGHHGIYGYSRQTTPELAKFEDLIVYDDVISAWGSTTNALRCLLTRSTLDDLYTPRCSIVDVFRKCSYNVALYSNQFRWGEYDGPIHLMFHGVSKMVYLQELKRQAFDWELLPLLEPYWKNDDTQVQILFLHLIGSHHDAVGRYPAAWGPFNGRQDSANAGVDAETAQRINEYDNSIAYTDHLLGELAKKIKGLERPAFLFYISDHGDIIDNKMDALRSSGNSNPLIYEIPMILLLNDAYKKAFPGFYEQAWKNRHQPLQADRMFWGLAALGGVRCDRENSEKSNIFSGQYQPYPVRKVSGGTEKYKRSSEVLK